MKKTLMLAGALTVAGVTLALLAPAKPALAGDQLNITSWGGAYQMSQRKAYFEPYAKQIGHEDHRRGIQRRDRQDPRHGRSQERELGCRRRRYPAAPSRAARRACWRPSIGRRSASTAPNSPAATSTTARCRRSSMRRSSPMTRTSSPNGPTKIADLFDLQKFPGKRALQKDPFVNLEWALIADGVAIEGRLQGPRHARRRRPRLQEAGYDQEGCRLVGGGRPAAAAARRRLGRHDLVLERTYL